VNHLPLVLASLLAIPAPVLGQNASSSCQVTPYRGATRPQGAVATVTMVNRGSPCLLPNYGLPSERANPATSGRITRPPRNSKASFSPPSASYLPDPGFVGDDEFEYEAWAVGASGQQLRHLVTVKVKVGAIE